jgi:cytochrome c biogenesis protein CcmG, thiol:disulfide interchange protein DsbE
MASDTSPSKQITASRAALVGLVALAVGLLAGCGGEELDPGNAAEAPDYGPVLEAAPPPLAELYEPGGVLLDGGRDAYEAQVAALEGYPIVVNKWASWCGPCRVEFPYFQSQAAELADRVAFVGIDADDSEDAATTFLANHPIPYPSFSDPDQRISESIDAAFAFPTTVFYDADGEIVHRRQGEYASEEELAEDIERYALGGGR